MTRTGVLRLSAPTLAVFVCLGIALRAASFGTGVTVGHMPSVLAEVSGLAQSRTQPEVFWAHNDSGDGPRVYAVSRTGALLATYTLDGASASDWEGMAIGPAPGGGSYLYLADIGDNTSSRRSIRVYRVREPSITVGPRPVDAKISGVTSFEFTYADGARDAEAFMVDPLTDDFYVVSKRELDGNRLYRSVAPKEGAVNTLTRVGRFDFTSTTAADISADGLQVLIRRYSNREVNPLTPPALAASYWSRPDSSVSLVDLLGRAGQIVPLVLEAQGEAIAFAADGRGFYTTTERGSLPGGITDQQAITYYERID